MTATEVREFVWAPDGRHFLYVSNAGDTGTWEVFRIPVEGGTPEQLTGKLVPEFATTPVVERAEPKEDLAVSTDGERIIFSSARYFERYTNIFSMSLGTRRGHPTQLPRRGHRDRAGPLPGRSHPGVVRSAGEREQDQPPGPGHPGGLAPSLRPGRSPGPKPGLVPRRPTLAFIRGGAIWVRAVEGGEARRVVGPEYPGVGSPVWSPDGTRMAVTSGPERLLPDRGGGVGHRGPDAHHLGPAGAHVPRLVPGRVDAGLHCERRPGDEHPTRGGFGRWIRGDRDPHVRSGVRSGPAFSPDGAGASPTGRPPPIGSRTSGSSPPPVELPGR
jgi:hypothetical protein